MDSSRMYFEKLKEIMKEKQKEEEEAKFRDGDIPGGILCGSGDELYSNFNYPTRMDFQNLNKNSLHQYFKPSSKFWVTTSIKKSIRCLLMVSKPRDGAGSNQNGKKGVQFDGIYLFLKSSECYKLNFTREAQILFQNCLTIDSEYCLIDGLFVPNYFRDKFNPRLDFIIQDVLIFKNKLAPPTFSARIASSGSFHFSIFIFFPIAFFFSFPPDLLIYFSVNF